MVVRILLILILCPSLIMASDSLRTVREFGFRVLYNLNIKDTLEGNARLDSIGVQKYVRDAAVDINTLFPTENAKEIITVSGTFGYLVDNHLVGIDAVILNINSFAQQLDVVPFAKFAEAYSPKTDMEDSTLEFCSVYGDSIYPFPIPLREDTLYIFYRARGKVPVASTDTVYVDHEYYSAIEYAATVKAAAHLENAAKLAMYQPLLDIEIEKFMREKKPQ